MRDQVKRFWSKVDKTSDPNGCWLWTASTTSYGYGQILFDGKNCRSHRLAYELMIGQVPEGLELDHLCRVPACVNPAHLEPVTHRENILRGEAPPAQYARRSHCPQGHAFDEANTYMHPAGGRRCRACKCIEERARYRRRMAQAS